MRWEAQALQAGDGTGQDGGGTPAAPAALLPLSGLQRSITTPEFAGITFHEVVAKSALNRVPDSSSMPFRWTVNPYRGCTHACRYCYARGTHEYLDLDAGVDFDRQIVVKVNVAEVLRRELSRPSWAHEPVALGTNTDPYQRAEGRYRLMPGIIRALADTGTPFSILTKGTLLGRDLELLAEASRHVPVHVSVSLAMLDGRLAERVEPGTPAPAARLRLIERLAAAGAAVTVMAMPLLPWLTDSERQLEELMAVLAGAGARSVLAGALHLRPGARQWYLDWIAAEHPELLEGYRSLYARGAYAAPSYRSALGRRAGAAARRHGLDHGGAHRLTRPDGPGRPAPERPPGTPAAPRTGSPAGSSAVGDRPGRPGRAGPAGRTHPDGQAQAALF
ncbi:radical SAM protein [Citricoccus sp. SGAir0253]|uniref:Rv2578c family radical SAM protein n=1 Tax=Citricoccus sp. SGAir0253 TaxID=2567881 RepID=UPI0010CD3112|nr:Rv2578c family radical SAM protein [Citricoccus sp. SGAir0253]QCU77769.1 radical SAM protein [Citricoccus sp. SGAir0253]